MKFWLFIAFCIVLTLPWAECQGAQLAILPALIGAIGAIGAAGIGAAARSSAAGDAQAQIEEAVKRLEEVGIPSAEARQIVLEQYQLQGQLTPELEQAILAPQSEAAGVETDPAYREAEMEALNELGRIGDEGGMTLTDKANLEDVLGDARRQARGAREANLATVRSRGQLGSGLELAAMNDADQAAVDQTHEDALRIAGMAEDRALSSIMSSGKLAGEMDDRQFNQDFRKGTAADEIAKFNTQTRQGVQTRNVERTNDAAAKNLQAKQSVSDRNTDLRNKQEVYNKGVQREVYEDEMNKAKAVAGAKTGQAQQTYQQGKDTADMIGNVGSGVVKLFGSQKEKDDDEEEF